MSDISAKLDHAICCGIRQRRPDTKARYPLREASVEVVEIHGSRGSYRAIAWIKPHFQLEGLSMSLRLVADLPSSVS